MSEPRRVIQISLEEQLKANGIPVSLDPESKPIICGRWCICRISNSRCNNPGEGKRQNYVQCHQKFELNWNRNKYKNLSILYSLKLCRTSSRMHWSFFSATGYRLSEIKNREFRRIVELRRSFTEVPIELLHCARQIDPINLSRQQWKVLLPTLQDHFPSVPCKFYLLLIKLSLGLGFLTKRLCDKYTQLCPFILGRCLTPRLVRIKYARALRLFFWEKPVNQPNWLDIFFPLNSWV